MTIDILKIYNEVSKLMIKQEAGVPELIKAQAKVDFQLSRILIAAMARGYVSRDSSGKGFVINNKFHTSVDEKLCSSTPQFQIPDEGSELDLDFKAKEYIVMTTAEFQKWIDFLRTKSVDATSKLINSKLENERLKRLRDGYIDSNEDE